MDGAQQPQKRPPRARRKFPQQTAKDWKRQVVHPPRGDRRQRKNRGDPGERQVGRKLGLGQLVVELDLKSRQGCAPHPASRVNLPSGGVQQATCQGETGADAETTQEPPRQPPPPMPRRSHPVEQQPQERDKDHRQGQPPNERPIRRPSPGQRWRRRRGLIHGLAQHPRPMRLHHQLIKLPQRQAPAGVNQLAEDGRNRSPPFKILQNRPMQRR